MKDSEIIDIILNGNKDKFRDLVEEYQQMVFRTCIGFVHNKEDADDITQEVFIQAWKSLSGFKGNSSFSTWLYRIAVNASLNRVRKASGQSIFNRLDSLFTSEKKIEFSFQAPEDQNPENILISKENSLKVQKALDSLPENQRTAIILSKYDDLPQKEIAAIMKVTEGAVEALIQRAKQNLRQKLSGP